MEARKVVRLCAKENREQAGSDDQAGEFGMATKDVARESRKGSIMGMKTVSMVCVSKRLTDDGTEFKFSLKTEWNPVLTLVLEDPGFCDVGHRVAIRICPTDKLTPDF